MPKITNSGIYILEILLSQDITITLRKNIKHELHNGYYYYIGSAQKNLKSRVERHKKKNKIIHWHIDNITVNENADLTNVFIYEGLDKSFECRLREMIEVNFELLHPIKRFGNSDCNECESHLLFSKSKIDIQNLTVINFHNNKVPD